MKIRTFLLLLTLISCMAGRTQDPAVIRAYIENYQQIAIEEMQRTGVPASIKLAQGIHETTAGTSVLVRKSNNHFGIKCKSNWTGERVSHTDDAPNECFRKYDDPAQSYRDHSDFLRSGSRYASLFNLDPLDYSGWAYGLKKAGYATNPKYPQIIIRLIEEYHLQDYTLIAMGKMQPAPDVKLASVKENTETVPAMNDVKEIIPELPDYPSGEFKINDTRVVVGKKETPLLALAQKYDVSLSRLLEFNELPLIEVLEKDQLIYLQRKKKTGDHEHHIVRPGETLQWIAQVEAIRLESLLEYNHLKANMQPAPGEKLYLRSVAPVVPKLEKRELAIRE